MLVVIYNNPSRRKFVPGSLYCLLLVIFVSVLSSSMYVQRIVIRFTGCPRKQNIFHNLIKKVKLLLCAKIYKNMCKICVTALALSSFKYCISGDIKYDVIKLAKFSGVSSQIGSEWMLYMYLERTNAPVKAYNETSL